MATKAKMTAGANTTARRVRVDATPKAIKKSAAGAAPTVKRTSSSAKRTPRPTLSVPKRPTYTVTAERSGKWWALEAPHVPGAFSQVRRLEDAEAMIREAIALVLKVPGDSFDVDVQTRIDGGEIDSAVETALRLRSLSALVKEQADVALKNVVFREAQAGLAVRDIAATLDLSHQYVARIAATINDGFAQAGVARHAETMAKIARSLPALPPEVVRKLQADMAGMAKALEPAFAALRMSTLQNTGIPTTEDSSV